MQTPLYFWLDGFLIRFFRITGITVVDYVVGILAVALICVVTGQLTYCWVYRRNHAYLNCSGKKMLQMHTLSLRALKTGDKAAYTSCNCEANDAFGKHYFAQVATGMAAVWPLPFALAWMQIRFGRVDFHLPMINTTVGYLFTFLPVYIAVYTIFTRAKSRLPWFRQFDLWLQKQEQKM